MEHIDIPLVVDLDGTLLQTDSLWESVFAILAADPLRIFRLAPLLLHNDRAGLKADCAEYALPCIAFWPFNAVVLQEIAAARQAGRKVWLATAAHETIAEAVSVHLHCFDGVLATSGTANLKGGAKAEKLRHLFGKGGFDYIGNSLDDLPVWAICREAMVVSDSEAVQDRAAEENQRCRMLAPTQSSGPAVWLRAARVRQWVKNILVAVPLLLSHTFTLSAFTAIFTAFLSFSLCASALYMINDLLDLTADRRHATKKKRPFASGMLHPAQGLALSGLLLSVSAGTALLINDEFAAVVACYALLTLLYTGIFKAQLIVDAVCLAVLYTLRIAAGVAALQADMSSWVLGFSFFIFLGLAFIKRLVEIQRAAEIEQLPGRAYKFSDGIVMKCMAASSGFAALIILSLYIDSINAVRLYSVPQLLWIICPIILYWYCRLLILTHRDEMHDDPVFFVMRDKTSIVCGISAICVILCAI
jgi:4-hydroxybenzoate polyprenyltransferase/phosphoserine phosphatase